MEKQAEKVVPPSEEMTRVFNNDLILQGISANLPLSEVKLLRTVNSKWSSAFHKAFYKKSSVTFWHFDDASKYFEEIDPGLNSTLEFAFYSQLVDGYYEDVFFPKFGSWIVSLALRQTWNGSKDYIKFQNILLQLKNLKELEIHLKFDGDWPTAPPEERIEVPKLPNIKRLLVQIRPKEIDIFEMLQLLIEGQGYPQIEAVRVLPLIWRSFPSVEDLTFDDPHCSGRFDSLPTPILLQKIPNLFIKLSGLHLKCNESVLTDLLNLDVELTALTLDFTCSNNLSRIPSWGHGCTRRLNELLERHKSTLKSLKLIQVPPRQMLRNVYRYDLKFPLKMEKLETLSLTFPDFGFSNKLLLTRIRRMPRFSIRHFNFDEFCPNLKKYEMNVKSDLFGRFYKEKNPLENYKEKLRRYFIPTSVCLNVEEVLVPYPYVKGSDWESKKKDAKIRRKNYEDFVERLTLTFPKAVKEGIFPKPKPEGEDDNADGFFENWKLMDN